MQKKDLLEIIYPGTHDLALQAVEKICLQSSQMVRFQKGRVYLLFIYQVGAQCVGWPGLFMSDICEAGRGLQHRIGGIHVYM